MTSSLKCSIETRGTAQSFCFCSVLQEEVVKRVA
jgi:hypothetical protein